MKIPLGIFAKTKNNQVITPQEKAFFKALKALIEEKDPHIIRITGLDISQKLNLTQKESAQVFNKAATFLLMTNTNELNLKLSPKKPSEYIFAKEMLDILYKWKSTLSKHFPDEDLPLISSTGTIFDNSLFSLAYKEEKRQSSVSKCKI